MCPRNARKMAQNLRSFGHTAPKPKNGPDLWPHGSKPNSAWGGQGHLIRPHIPPPLVVVSPPKYRPNGRLDPCTGAHLALASRGLESKLVQAKIGPSTPPGVKKKVDPPPPPQKKKEKKKEKEIQDHLGCPKQVV